ncbi:hypothetical protein GCM10011391_12080 [Pullulanibacillus camelliae]|uniref:Carotenoid biosynthesis protein n=1 Tax=Pullulanibacillus camelliae TaxID=1707096 RepID=A0A8J2VS17_9BACL|nr:carotenoid biosynthesis protein [Pullulanibacillus camelliae]GGE34986.1 hypothetical protein GCM10011391_12080 [Pullulanibacillus camelliae]
MSNTAAHTMHQNSPGRFTYSPLRWAIIVLFIICSIATDFIPGLTGMVFSLISTLSVFALAILHGKERYGFKSIIIFLIMTWVISNGLEGLSIQTGFPFGHYYYTVQSFNIWHVPFIIMPAYFGMGYMAWTLSQVLNGQFGRKLKGIYLFLVPFVASFIMVMWDVVMDPIQSTINKSWIWRNGGHYFGVPISNYLGWFFVVYVFFQLFALYLSKFDKSESALHKGKAFWFEAVAVYGLQSLSLLLTALVLHGHRDIYSSMGLVNIFTMVFVTLISLITIANHPSLSASQRQEDAQYQGNSETQRRTS